ncbi:ABC transporter substrate-binding protein [Arthrobacter sp. 179]|uniref:ABC transporter substrate-binding protein n=1 Tax=Arthrobacter sp. 179 TaxID=3457734 RepID=UPI004033250A
MKRTHLGGLAIIASTALALTACGGAGNGATADSSAIVVDMWAGSDDDTNVLNKQLDMVKEDHPDMDVSMRMAPWGDYFTKMTTNMASGNMACVSGMNSGQLSSYTDGFAELTAEDLETAGLSEDDFAPGALEILKKDGKLYGIPFDVSTMLVYYNADMFQKSGVDEPALDWTFKDFEKTAEDATQDGKHGFAVGMAEFQWQALPIAKAGTQPVTADGTLDMTNPAFVDAASWYSSLVTEKKVAAPAASASEAGWGETQYTSGNAAMAVDGTWNAVGYLDNDNGFKAGLAPLPTGENGSLGLVMGSGFGIAKDCANKDEALKVLGSLLSKKSQDYIASTGRSYPARAASQPVYFESLDPEYRDDVQEVFDQAFEQLEGQNVTDDWSQVGTYIQPNLVSVYNGQEKMADMLSNTQNQFAK